jgi:hypothetical protein
MIIGGSQQTNIIRNVPTVVEVLSRVGGFYYIVYGTVLVFSMIILSSYEDNRLLDHWIQIKE